MTTATVPGPLTPRSPTAAGEIEVIQSAHSALRRCSRLTDRMRALLSKALDVLDHALDNDGRVAQDAAVQVLKACGIYGVKPPAGYTRAEDFEIAEQEQKGDRRRRLMFAALSALG